MDRRVVVVGWGAGAHRELPWLPSLSPAAATRPQSSHPLPAARRVPLLRPRRPWMVRLRRRHHRRRRSEWEGRRDDGGGGAAVQSVPWKKPEERGDVALTVDLRDAGRRARAALAAAAGGAAGFGKGFAREGRDFVADLRSSVSVVDGPCFLISMRRSSLEFAGRLLLCSLLLAALWRMLAAASCKYPWRRAQQGEGLIRRDRSLGGREVLVGKRMNRMPHSQSHTVRKAANPLDGVDTVRSEKKLAMQRARKLPSPLPGWWPDWKIPSSTPALLSNNPTQVKELAALMSAIVERRLNGQDFEESDIIQLRRLCKCSRTKVKFDTLNTRDSFYRAAIDFVLSSCCRHEAMSIPAEYAGEKVAEFIAGLATDIELDAVRAMTMVNAAVAAQTRSSFLQAWAFVIQRRNKEAKKELLKLGRIHACFPPEKNSPEIEMVAQGLAKHLPLEERMQLFQMYLKETGSSNYMVASEALDLVASAERGWIDSFIKGWSNVP